MFKERQFGVSTECTGVFGNERDWLKIWGFLIGKKNFAGIEATGWLWSSKLIQRYLDYGINVLGDHGKTGGILESYNLFDSGKLFILNRILLSEKSLISIGQRFNLEYVLIHHPKLRTAETRKLIIASKDKIKRIMFENHHKLGGIVTAADEVNTFRSFGVNAGLTVDLGHSLATEDGFYLNDFNEIWKLTMDRTQSAIKTLKDKDNNTPIMLHIALGEVDCIPKERMDAAKWKEVADLTMTHPDILIIIENQQLIHESFKLTHQMAQKQRGRNMKNIDLMVDMGIIKT